MKRLKNRVLIDFTSGLSLLLEAGLPLSEALRMMGSSRDMRELAGRIEGGLSGGFSLSSLVSGEDSPFPPIYRGLVSIGEETGSLSRVLPALASYLERRKKVRDKLINSSIYPAIVLGAAITGLILLSVFILPRLEMLFSSLTDSTEQLGAIRRNIRIFSGAAGGAAGLTLLVIFFILAGRRSEQIKAFIGMAALMIPVTGKLISHTNIYSLVFALEVLTGEGVPVSRAMESAAGVCPGILFRQAVEKTGIALNSGRSLTAAFSEQDIFPQRLVRWVEIGESTGKTEKVFGQLRIFYESEIENLASRFMGVIEPLLILIVGGIIIILVIAFVVPLISLFGNVI